MKAPLFDLQKVYVAGAAALALLLVGAAGGGWFGYRLGRGDAPRLEDTSPRAAVRQADGSLVAPRVPAPTDLAPAPHRLPPKVQEERRIAVTVQPSRQDCPPVRVDLSLVQDASGRRVVASSPDGTVLDALDMPIIAGLVPPVPKRWAAGLRWEPRHERAGAWVERDFGRLRLGADLAEDLDGGIAAVVRVGITF